MTDYIVRAIAANSQIRAFACTTKEMVEAARKRHNTSPIVTAGLGRLLSAGAMMGSMLKGEKDILTLQVQGDGAMKGLTVTADSNAKVKGYALNPLVILPPNNQGKLDVGGAIGNGFLRVIKDMGLKEPYVGETILQTGEIAEDLTYYFAVSEQVPSSVGLGVLMEKDNTVKRSGGFIIQLMPFTEDGVIEQLEKNLLNIPSVTTMLGEESTPEDILNKVLEGFDIEILDKIPTEFYCNCSKERVEKAVISIGRKDISEMIEDGKDITVNCHFCNESYTYSTKELEEMLAKAK